MTGSRSTAAARIAAADPGGLLYGAIISASVLATVSAHSDQYEYVALATAVVLGVYWLTHVYVAAHSRQFDGDTRHVLHRAAVAAGHEASVLKGGVPAIVVYLVGAVIGLGPGPAAEVAVYFSVAMLMCVGYLAAHRAGRTGGAALADAAVAGLFGLVVVVAKALLH
jgi:hypothetical protein